MMQNKYYLSITSFAQSLLLILLSLIYSDSYAQYFNKIFDYNNSIDWGYDIFLNSDSSYFITGETSQNGWGITASHLTNNGNQISNTRVIYNFGTNHYIGTGTLSGRVKRLYNKNYLVPITVEYPSSNASGFARGGGIALLDSLGDTILTRMFTDTANYDEQMNDCIVMPDSGYLVGGYRNSINGPINQEQALLIRTDKQGHLLWTKTYSIKRNEITSLQLLTNGKLLIGAQLKGLVWVGPYFYYRSLPDFILADSANGNILKDTSLYIGYMWGGNIFQDANGGYFHWGKRDTMAWPSPSDYSNFPDYLMHLDDSFHIAWRKDFNWDMSKGHRYIWNVKQTKDNGYVAMGAEEVYLYNFDSTNNELFGWAAKVNQQGNIVWEHNYIIDSSKEAYITDAIEKPWGGYTFTGSTKDGSLPLSRQNDLWLISVDSNGCLIPGCDPLKIKQSPLQGDLGVTVYPNPVTSQLTVKGITKGTTIQLFDITGREVHYAVATQTFEEINISSLIPGTYVLQLTDRDGNRVTKKIVKE
jgi:hypothetical protein